MLLSVSPLLLARAGAGGRGASVGVFREWGKRNKRVKEAGGEVERLDEESEGCQAPEVDTPPLVPDHEVRAQVIELASERRGFVFMLSTKKKQASGTTREESKKERGTRKIREKKRKKERGETIKLLQCPSGTILLHLVHFSKRGGMVCKSKNNTRRMNAPEGNRSAAWATFFPFVALIIMLLSITTRTKSYARRQSGQAAVTGVFSSVPMQAFHLPR